MLAKGANIAKFKKEPIVERIKQQENKIEDTFEIANEDDKKDEDKMLETI